MNYTPEQLREWADAAGVVYKKQLRAFADKIEECEHCKVEVAKLRGHCEAMVSGAKIPHEGDSMFALYDAIAAYRRAFKERT